MFRLGLFSIVLIVPIVCRTNPSRSFGCLIIDNQTKEIYLRSNSNSVDRTSTQPLILSGRYASTYLHPLCPPDLLTIRNKFQAEKYEGNLLIADRVSSTMDLSNEFLQIPDLLVVAKEQTNGRDRQKGQYISPVGDIYMTMNIKLHQNVSIHNVAAIAARTTTEVLKELHGDQRLDLSYLWPNRISWNKGANVIGGVLVEKSFLGDSGEMVYQIGIGVRLNSTVGEPTLRAAVSTHNTIFGTNLNHVSHEKLIVKIANRVRENTRRFEKDEIGFQNYILSGLLNHQDQTYDFHFQGIISRIGSNADLILTDPSGNELHLKVKANAMSHGKKLKTISFY